MVEESSQTGKLPPVFLFTEKQLDWFITQKTPVEHIRNVYFKRISVKYCREFIRNIFHINSSLTLKQVCGADKSSIWFGKQYTKEFIKNDKGVLVLDPIIQRAIKKDLEEMFEMLLNTLEDKDTKEELEEDAYALYPYRKVNRHTSYDVFRENLCEDEGSKEYIYDFDTDDIPVLPPQNTNMLQRTKLQILSNGVRFDYPLVHLYCCPEPECETKVRKYAYETASTNGRINCTGLIHTTTAAGEPRVKRCSHSLYPDKELSVARVGYYYEINFEDNGEKNIASAIGFKNYRPGYYEVVLFRLSNTGKTELFLIVDVRKMPPNVMQLPVQNSNENYLFTLQQYFDKYILEKTGMHIYGLYPIKCSLILQAFASHSGERLISNVMVVGDPSTGKSLLLKYYPFLLYNYYNLSTNGLSVSIAGLRGTRSSIMLFGKDIKIVTIGHLGVFKGIHLDEAGENPELVQNLKTFLLEDNYSYDKAGSTGVTNKRSAHVNVSQNLDYEHVGAYRGAIRKAYKDLDMTIGGVEKAEWDESWDLFKPIHTYDTNPQLKKIIREKRLEFKQKQTWWIDGLDYALHERFPKYYYIVNEDGRDTMNLDIAIQENSTRNIISENLEIIRVLYTDAIENFFMSLNEYRISTDDIAAYKNVDTIIKQYGLVFDSRMKTFYYLIVKQSRMINKRLHYTEMDYDLVRWFLETTNIKLHIADTDAYKIAGPPDLSNEKTSLQREQDSKSGNERFGVQSGLGDDFI